MHGGPGTAAGHLFGGRRTVITNNEIIRLRRQMQQRIRAVVAERRMARKQDSPEQSVLDQGPVEVDARATHGEGSLICG
jgi:hypothetical protein